MSAENRDIRSTLLAALMATSSDGPVTVNGSRVIGCNVGPNGEINVITDGPENKSPKITIRGRTLSDAELKMLTEMELRILQCLYQFRNRPVLYETITVMIWRDPIAAKYKLSSISTHISAIRRVLSDTGFGDPITTIRGEGYRLNA